MSPERSNTDSSVAEPDSVLVEFVQPTRSGPETNLPGFLHSFRRAGAGPEPRADEGTGDKTYESESPQCSYQCSEKERWSGGSIRSDKATNFENILFLERSLHLLSGPIAAEDCA